MYDRPDPSTQYCRGNAVGAAKNLSYYAFLGPEIDWLIIQDELLAFSHNQLSGVL